MVIDVTLCMCVGHKDVDEAVSKMLLSEQASSSSTSGTSEWHTVHACRPQYPSLYSCMGSDPVYVGIVISLQFYWTNFGGRSKERLDAVMTYKNWDVRKSSR